jgi:hypothetical protein
VLSEEAPVALATDVVDAGEVPTHGETRRMLVLHNRSAWDVDYAWQRSGPAGDGATCVAVAVVSPACLCSDCARVSV